MDGGENGDNGGPRWGQALRYFAEVVGISLTCVILVVGSAFLGHLADSKLETKPLLTVLLLVFGLASAAWYAYRKMRDLIE